VLEAASVASSGCCKLQLHSLALQSSKKREKLLTLRNLRISFNELALIYLEDG